MWCPDPILGYVQVDFPTVSLFLFPTCFLVAYYDLAILLVPPHVSIPLLQHTYHVLDNQQRRPPPDPSNTTV